VSAFDTDAELSGDVALRLMAPSFVCLFWRTSVLETAIVALRERGYQVVRLDASAWLQEADLHRDIAAALDFPDYYGCNLDVLNDCLRDVVTYDYGTSREATGLVLVFIGYDAFHQSLSSGGADRPGHLRRPGPFSGADRPPHVLPRAVQRPNTPLRPCGWVVNGCAMSRQMLIKDCGKLDRLGGGGGVSQSGVEGRQSHPDETGTSRDGTRG
jgi:Barstar (barnase inhibitor)